MSELSGDRPRGSHGGSSLSIFSGVATSSASGTSDLDHVNVEELSEGSLQETLEEAQSQIRRLTLETKMFEGSIYQFLNMNPTHYSKSKLVCDLNKIHHELTKTSTKIDEINQD